MPKAIDNNIIIDNIIVIKREIVSFNNKVDRGLNLEAAPDPLSYNC